MPEPRLPAERDPRPVRDALAGRYRIEEELGRGGFATVHKVWNVDLGRHEALKVLKPGHEADEDFPRRFRHPPLASDGSGARPRLSPRRRGAAGAR